MRERVMVQAVRRALLPHAQAELDVTPHYIEPQIGPQRQFMETLADIAIIGGGAYGGKTFGLLLIDAQGDPIPNFMDPKWSSVTFRRDTNQIRNPGGLWDEAVALYRPKGGKPISGPLEIQWPSGAVTKFWHLEHATDVYAWDGSQIPCLKFDQLEHFEENMFWYMLSRNRDPSGHIKPYCRATCNPRPDHWLSRLLAWWIDNDPKTAAGNPNPRYGYAIPERSGVLRWFIRINDTLTWADSKQELWDKYARPDLAEDHPEQIRPKSITFIVAKITDNKIGMQKDPGYLGNLMLMPRHERLRLLGEYNLGGNWHVRPTAGAYFNRAWCKVLPEVPQDVVWCRGWDLAGTEPSSANPDPDWTVAVKVGRYKATKRYVVAHVLRMRDRPAKVEEAMENIAGADGVETIIRGPQDPGQAGKSQAAQLTTKLSRYSVRFTPVTGSKEVRFRPFSAQAQAGNVDLVIGLPEEYIRNLENFTGDDKSDVHDDDVDATSEAYAGVALGVTGEQVIDYFKALGGNLPKPQFDEQGHLVLPSMPSSPMSPIKIAPGASLAEIAAAVTKAKDSAVQSDALKSTLLLHTEPHRPFMFGAGIRYTADKDGWILAENEEHASVLIRAGCQRAPVTGTGTTT